MAPIPTFGTRSPPAPQAKPPAPSQRAPSTPSCATHSPEPLPRPSKKPRSSTSFRVSRSCSPFASLVHKPPSFWSGGVFLWHILCSNVPNTPDAYASHHTRCTSSLGGGCLCAPSQFPGLPAVRCTGTCRIPRRRPSPQTARLCRSTERFPVPGNVHGREFHTARSQCHARRDRPLHQQLRLDTQSLALRCGGRLPRSWRILRIHICYC